ALVSEPRCQRSSDVTLASSPSLRAPVAPSARISLPRQAAAASAGNPCFARIGSRSSARSFMFQRSAQDESGTDFERAVHLLPKARAARPAIEPALQRARRRQEHFGHCAVVIHVRIVEHDWVLRLGGVDARVNTATPRAALQEPARPLPWPVRLPLH